MIEFISIFKAREVVNLHLQLRRLALYSLEQLKEVYFYEKKKVLLLYSEIEKLYDVGKFNFAHRFNIKSRYVENLEFHNSKPDKDTLISIIILFLETKYLITTYLQQIREFEEI